MYFVYILKQQNSEHYYTGYTSNLQRRFKEHMLGTTKSTGGREWGLVSYFAFSKKEIAEKFEAYLKSGSGRGFIKRHFV